MIYPSERYTINIITQEVNLDDIKYFTEAGIGIVVTDGKKYNLEINEFGVRH